ncbi:DUF5343 domain-containing protein [Saccharopolyspora sp. 7B]|uniref:DUF5343 domain-containing protein n=1 Tax=Saccharopolyspora sp. 7B TaxID=2877240 RepID=UPI001CD23A2C|nr:DUF5343 domain-containing protein [Saccharopolyspora sp. 7B]MCA1278272.1 DUF5343 domain-containing protein [Saccharopolyspora sp. 7B]
MVQDEKTFVPPYLAFRVLMNTADRMAGVSSLPAAIDRSYLNWMSGTVQTAFLSTVRQFEFVGDQDVPTERLRRFVYEKESRPEIIGDLIREHYAPIIEIGQKHATKQQLHSLWKDNYGQDGDTRTRAIKFFLDAANFADIELSPEWAKTGGSSGGPAVPRPRRRRSRTAPKRTSTAASTGDQGHVEKVPLASGAGVLTVGVDADLFQISEEDRTFVFALVDMIHQYRQKHPNPAEPEDPADNDEEPE